MHENLDFLKYYTLLYKLEIAVRKIRLFFWNGMCTLLLMLYSHTIGDIRSFYEFGLWLYVFSTIFTCLYSSVLIFVAVCLDSFVKETETRPNTYQWKFCAYCTQQMCVNTWWSNLFTDNTIIVFDIVFATHYLAVSSLLGIFR